METASLGPPATMKFFIYFFGMVLGAPCAWAQLSVQVKPIRDQYLKHEPVMAVVTITNRSGRPLSFVSRTEGRLAHSWLDFSMRNTRGEEMVKMTRKVFRKAVIPAGQSVARRVNLGSMFDLSKVGNYAFTAHVRQPGVEDSGFVSNSGHVTVGNGSVMFQQSFGVPKSPVPKREYRVLTFNDGKKISIYSQVMDMGTGRALSTTRLSEYLPFVRPQQAIDRQNHLHVLYLAKPQIYVHVSISPSGVLGKVKYFKRVRTGAARLVTFTDGKVKVAGALPYDPEKEKAKVAKLPRVRGASERPE